MRAVQRQISEKIGEKINYYENNTNSSGTKRKRKLSRPNRSVRSIEATEFENNISYENLTCIKERDTWTKTKTRTDPTIKFFQRGKWDGLVVKKAVLLFEPGQSGGKE